MRCRRPWAPKPRRLWLPVRPRSLPTATTVTGATTSTTRPRNPISSTTTTATTTPGATTTTRATTTTLAPRPQPQTISFAVPGGGAVKYADGRTIALGATASSGLPVVYDVAWRAALRAPGWGRRADRDGILHHLSQPGWQRPVAAGAKRSRWPSHRLNGDSDFNLDVPGTVAAADGVVTLRLTNVVGSDSFTVSGSGACPDGTDVTGASSFNLALSGPGTCTVTVDQNGNQNFNIGPTHTANITVT